MRLLHCDGWHGETEVRTGRPHVATYHDAIYVPARMAGYDPDSRWGLYKDTGEIIPEAAYIRGPFFEHSPTALVGQSSTINEIDKADSTYSYDDYIYMGPLQDHYGHFIITALARAWFLNENIRENRKLLFHTNSDIKVQFSRSYVKTIMGALGISEKDIVILDSPTILRSIVVPAPSFQELSFSSAAHAEVGRYIARKLGMESETAVDRPIYFSKSKLKSGIWQFHNEDVIVEILKLNGFDIIFPENLSFIEQVRIFNRYDFLCSSAGSALHTSMFALRPKKILGIGFERQIQSNFMLLDKVMGHNSKYYYPEDTVRVEPKPGFHLGFNIGDPAKIADSILESFRQFDKSS